MRRSRTGLSLMLKSGRFLERFVMTTLKCKKCSAFYPPTDTACPSCGYPSGSMSPSLKTALKLSILLVVVASVWLWLWFFGGGTPKRSDGGISDAKVVASAFTAVKAISKDPGSAKFGHVVRRNVGGEENAACGTVNSKNSFGGYVGEKRFIYMYERQTVLFDDDTPDFSTSWQSLCR